jgi:hypothetical protein
MTIWYLRNKTRWRWLSGSTELAERPVEINGLRQAQATFPPTQATFPPTQATFPNSGYVSPNSGYVSPNSGHVSPQNIEKIHNLL